MLIFVTTARHDYAIRSMLDAVGSDLRRHLLLLDYDEFLGWRRLPMGSYILADLERLSAEDAAQVARRVDALRDRQPDTVVLNDPRRHRSRLSLLETLHASGRNDFAARRADAPLDGLRYPVFIREAVEHSGAVSERLPDAAALAEALTVLARGPRPLSDYLVIEFIDVRNAAGHFEKYSVLRIGEHWIASDLSLHTDWVVKGEAHESRVPGDIELDAAFQRDNPHVDRLREVYAIAGIDYGRIDYAFHDGRLQVFEINTNPMLPVPADADPAYRASTLRYLDGVLAGLAAVPDYGAAGAWRAVGNATHRGSARSPARALLRRLLATLRLLQHEPPLMALIGRLRQP